jgi:hypothetical protein
MDGIARTIRAHRLLSISLLASLVQIASTFIPSCLLVLATRCRTSFVRVFRHLDFRRLAEGLVMSPDRFE